MESRPKAQPSKNPQKNARHFGDVRFVKPKFDRDGKLMYPPKVLEAKRAFEAARRQPRETTAGTTLSGPQLDTRLVQKAPISAGSTVGEPDHGYKPNALGNDCSNDVPELRNDQDCFQNEFERTSDTVVNSFVAGSDPYTGWNAAPQDGEDPSDMLHDAEQNVVVEVLPFPPVPRGGGSPTMNQPPEWMEPNEQSAVIPTTSMTCPSRGGSPIMNLPPGLMEPNDEPFQENPGCDHGSPLSEVAEGLHEHDVSTLSKYFSTGRNENRVMARRVTLAESPKPYHESQLLDEHDGIQRDQL